MKKKVIIMIISIITLTACNNTNDPLYPPTTTTIEAEADPGDITGTDTIKATADYSIKNSAFAITEYDRKEAPLMVGIFPVTFSTSVVYNPLPYVKGAIVKENTSSNYPSSVHFLYRVIENKKAEDAVKDAPEIFELPKEVYNLHYSNSGHDKNNNPQALFDGSWILRDGEDSKKSINVIGGMFSIAKTIGNKTYIGTLLISSDVNNSDSDWSKQVGYLINSVYLKDR